MYVPQKFPSYLQYVAALPDYLVKVENPKKILLIFTPSSTNWNKLSTEIKNSPSVTTFKTKLKQFLLDSY